MIIIAAVFWALVALVLQAAGILGSLLWAAALVFGVCYGGALALWALASLLGAAPADRFRGLLAGPVPFLGFSLWLGRATRPMRATQTLGKA